MVSWSKRNSSILSLPFWSVNTKLKLYFPQDDHFKTLCWPSYQLDRGKAHSAITVGFLGEKEPHSSHLLSPTLGPVPDTQCFPIEVSCTNRDMSEKLQNEVKIILILVHFHRQRRQYHPNMLESW